MGVIAVFSTKGGVGKSLITLNLAHWIKPQQLIDSDVGSGLSDLAGLGASHKPTLVKTLAQAKAALKGDGIALADCGGFDSDVNRYILAMSNIILVPSGVSPSDQFGLLATSKVLAAISKATGHNVRGQIVINDVNPRQSDFSVIEEIVSATGNLSIIRPIIPHAAAINAASLKGEAVMSGEIAARFKALAANVQRMVS
ncbi:ParA family protein [Aeromonas caviae]|uniref:ParA family protein n=1 Tax=Aeromonas TaxID=642 RepID=UPI00341AEE37